MKKIKNLYFQNYIQNFNRAILDGASQEKDLIDALNILLKIKKNNVHIFGNGGSASIASHFSMDLTNNSKIKCYSYNNPALITCFSNDFKFENWISRALNKYGNKNDLLILISSSGESKNMLNAIKEAKKKKFYKIITFTGFSKNNKLKKKGDVNFWINSKDYNVIESVHHLYLLMLVDMVKKFK